MALLTTSYSSGPYFGGNGNRTGSAGTNAGCDGPFCHGANGGSSSLSIALLLNGVPVTGYNPGQFYRIRLTLPVTNPLHRNFGFQASIVRASDGVTQAGILLAGSRTDLSVYQDVLVQLVEHNRYLRSTQVPGGYLDTVSFVWQAPQAGAGAVRVFAVINAVDSNRNSSGDQPRAGFQDFREIVPAGGVGVSAPSNTAVFSISPNPVSGGMVQLRGLQPGIPAVISVLDLRGAVVLHYSAIPGPTGALRLDTRKLQSGTFAIRASQGDLNRSGVFEVK